MLARVPKLSESPARIPVQNSKRSKVQHRLRHCSKLAESLNATVQAECEKQDRAARVTSQPGT